MRALLRCGVTAMVLLCGFAVAGAQQPDSKGKALASPEQQAEQERAQQSKEGQAGTTEPSSETKTAKPQESAVFVDGRLAVPGAPADSQTVPAKFSKRNAALDELPIMAFPTPLTDDQRQRILAAVKNSSAPMARVDLRPADQLPSAVEMRELPDQVTAGIPAVRNQSYVRTEGGILLVIPASRIVMTKVPN